MRCHDGRLSAVKSSRLSCCFLFFIAVAVIPQAFASPAIAGLWAPVNVTRDVDGIAHVSALNEHDMFFMQGWVHAEDRLFQMDTNRRQASGTLAELLGKGALAGDVQIRTIGLRRSAERTWSALQAAAAKGDRDAAGAVAALKAYSDGVNAYVSQLSQLPPEYGALGLTQFEPWTPLDSIVVGKLIAFGLSFDLGDIDNSIRLQAYAQVLGAQAGQALFFDDLFRSQPFDPASTVPDSGGSGPLGHGHHRVAMVSSSLNAGRLQALNEAAKLGKRYLQRARQSPVLARIIKHDRTALGSNEWGVSGKVSLSGDPMIANDPHLSLGEPSTFYPMQIRAPGYAAMGSGFAGTPFIIVGRNRDIAWGPTTNPMDVTDVFQDKVVQDATSPSGLAIVLPDNQLGVIVPVPETYRVNADTNGDGKPDGVLVTVPPGGAIPAQTLTVPARNNGAIIDFDTTAMTALTVQYTGFAPTRELETFYIWNKSRDLTDFKRGLSFFDFGSQNWSYADRKGNLAYFASGEMPVRTDLETLGHAAGLPPWFIRQGDLALNQWMPRRHTYPNQVLNYEIYSPSEMPQVLNPKNGWFVNANNDPVGTTLDNNPLNSFRSTGGVFYLSNSYSPGFRAGRITQGIRRLLATGDRKISFAEMQALQADVGLRDAEFFVPLMEKAYQESQQEGVDPALASAGQDPRLEKVMQQLQGWASDDYQAKTGIAQGYDSEDVDGNPAGSLSPKEIEESRATAIYSMWRSQFIRRTIDQTLKSMGLGGELPGSSQVVVDLRHLVENGGQSASGVAFFNEGAATPAANVQAAMLRAISAALDRFEDASFKAAFSACDGNADDYRWGCLHRIVFASPLGAPFSVPDGFGVFPAPFASLPGIPTDGGFGTVDAASHNSRANDVNGFMFSSGPTNRLVVRVDRHGMKAQSVWPSGTSAIPGSPFYIEPMLPRWLTNDADPLRFTLAEVARGAYSSDWYWPAWFGFYGKRFPAP
ncbi:penicillin acylase family protein [Mangrovitalea sediminis]|uniref:penicillin acylase family protein n=1 Tax=Mangrovitalea sediminis TaxID=1982043 RepID=UPI0013041033|nr:penicillin acylase family protein [Mangrovitalea sediminis]